MVFEHDKYLVAICEKTGAAEKLFGFFEKAEAFNRAMHLKAMGQHDPDTICIMSEIGDKEIGCVCSEFPMPRLDQMGDFYDGYTGNNE